MKKITEKWKNEAKQNPAWMRAQMAYDKLCFLVETANLIRSPLRGGEDMRGNFYRLEKDLPGALKEFLDASRTAFDEFPPKYRRVPDEVEEDV